MKTKKENDDKSKSSEPHTFSNSSSEESQKSVGETLNAAKSQVTKRNITMEKIIQE